MPQSMAEPVTRVKRRNPRGQLRDGHARGTASDHAFGCTGRFVGRFPNAFKAGNSVCKPSIRSW